MDFFERVHEFVFTNKEDKGGESGGEKNANFMKPIDLTTKNRSLSSHQNVSDSEAIHRQLQQEMEDRQQNIEHFNRLFIFEPASNKWDRFKSLIFVNSYGFHCWEYSAACFMGTLGFFVGLALRKPSSVARSVQRFKVQHNLSLFDSSRDYVSRLGTFMGINLLAENVPKGLRIACISYMSTFTITGLACIRDRAAFYDFIIGYGTAGFLYRFQRGFKAAFAAGLIGSCFGAMIPLLVWPYSLYSGQTLDDIYKKERQEFYANKMKKLKMDREISNAMAAYNVGYFAAKEKVQELRESEKSRLGTLHNLNVDALLNSSNSAQVNNNKSQSGAAGNS